MDELLKYVTESDIDSMLNEIEDDKKIQHEYPTPTEMSHTYPTPKVFLTSATA